MLEAEHSDGCPKAGIEHSPIACKVRLTEDGAIEAGLRSSCLVKISLSGNPFFGPPRKQCRKSASPDRFAPYPVLLLCQSCKPFTSNPQRQDIPDLICDVSCTVSCALPVFRSEGPYFQM